MIALSATAAPRVRADMIRLLKLRKPFVKVCSARRENLNYSMRLRSKDPLPQVLTALRNSRGASLLYTRTRRSVEKWTEILSSAGIPAIPYHAGLDNKSRKHALFCFQEESNPVLVATVAFGMGIDRPDVGLVLHLNLPSTPERYLQESGRAGRDGLPAECMLLFSPADRIKLGWAIKSSEKLVSQDLPSKIQRYEIAQEQLRNMEAVAESGNCREQSLLHSVGEMVSPCGRCDRCLQSSVVKDWSKQAVFLLQELDQKIGHNIHNLANKLSNNEDLKIKTNWGWLARRLVQEEFISETNDGSQTLFLRDLGYTFLEKPWPLNYAN